MSCLKSHRTERQQPPLAGDVPCTLQPSPACRRADSVVQQLVPTLHLYPCPLVGVCGTALLALGPGCAQQS